MISRRVTAGVLLLLATAAQAQKPLTYFDRAAYVTCREVDAMSIEVRATLTGFLIQHAAQMRSVPVPNGDHRAQVEGLIRGGCVLSPEAHFYTIVDRAIVTQDVRLPRRQ